MSLVLSGCTGIAIEPSCPKELLVGESGSVFANQENEGAIPTFLWEVFPDEAGELENPAAPTTKFQAAAAGQVVFRLTASDGLYQVISECGTRVISFADLSVSIGAGSVAAKTGDTVTLTCSTPRALDGVVLAVEQVSGASVDLVQGTDGNATFVPDNSGALTFLCSAVNAEGARAQSALLTVSVIEAPDTDGGGTTPPRPGRR